MEDEYIKMGVGSSAEENYFSLNAAGLSFQKFGSNLVHHGLGRMFLPAHGTGKLFS